MKKRLVTVLLMVLALSAGIASAPATEPQSSVENMRPLSAIPAQSGKPAWLTPGKEAALVEVRKILREAREVAESIQIPNQLLADRHRIKSLEELKARLIEENEQAQFRAGEFHAAGTTKQVDLLALAQAAYGKTEDAVQTTARPRVTSDNELLVLVDMLVKVGDVPAALKAVDATLAKGVTRADHAQRFRNRAAALALIARRQYEHGDPAAKTTLQHALEAAQDVIAPEDSYWAFLHVARAQGMLGDRTGSVESFQKAFRAAKGRGTELYPLPNKLLWLAKAQAESGDILASLKTFEETIQLRHAMKEPRARVIHLQCAAWAQTAVGLAKVASLTFKKALEDAESIAPENRWHALSEVGRWQLTAGDDQGAAETVQYLFQKAENLPDSAQKTTAFGTVRTLAVWVGNWKLAIDLLVTISDDWEKAGALRAISESLVRTKDPYGTPDVFTQLSESASAILKNPPPKERSKVVTMRFSIAIVQAAGGNLDEALKTADAAGGSERIRTYGRVANLLTAKGDLSGAQQTISSMKEEWLFSHSSEGVVRKLANAKAKSGDATGALDWGRKQASDYAKAQALLGVADGLMDYHGIEDIEHLVPAIPLRDVCSLKLIEPL